MDADARRCSATRRDGTACRSPAHTIGPDGRCWAHSPARRAERAAARAKGGARKSNAARLSKLVPATLRPVLATLLAALDEVHGGGAGPTITPAQASAMASLAGAIVKVYGIGHLEERLAALEGRLNA